MQLGISVLGTVIAATVVESMDKRGAIPGHAPKYKPKNAAPKADIERVLKRIEHLGIDPVVAAERAGLSRVTGFRFKDYGATVGTLQDIEEWVAKEERRQKLPPQPTGEEQNAMFVEWDALGRDLASVDPARFQETLEGLRDVVQARKLEEKGFRKIFRANPDPDR